MRKSVNVTAVKYEEVLTSSSEHDRNGAKPTDGAQSRMQ